MYQLKDRPVQLYISQKVTLEKQSKNNILCKNFLASTNLLTVIIPQNIQVIHRHFNKIIIHRVLHHRRYSCQKTVFLGTPLLAYISSDRAITFRVDIGRNLEVVFFSLGLEIELKYPNNLFQHTFL